MPLNCKRYKKELNEKMFLSWIKSNVLFPFLCPLKILSESNNIFHMKH